MADVQLTKGALGSVRGRSRGKRAFDIVVSGLCIVFFSPLFLICYVLIKAGDGGPCIFSQERIGLEGKPFMIYKFRSMCLKAEREGPVLSATSSSEDPRQTKVGRVLRAHHLDELPQLWNVFVGDMSLVGYRPERKYFIDKIMQEDARYSLLYAIRPGVTSYATLYNRYTDTMDKMLKRLDYDIYYLNHQSFAFDMKVLLLTFAYMVSGKRF